MGKESAGQGVPLVFVRQYYDDPVAHDLWPFSVTYGYGRVRYQGRNTQAHILACTWAHGPKPTPQHQVAHSCRNRHCYYAGHLRWATVAENLADREADGTLQRGEINNKAKLTEAQVIEIRLRYLTGESSAGELVREYGVTPQTVWAIHAGKTWKHLWTNFRALDEVA